MDVGKPVASAVDSKYVKLHLGPLLGSWGSRATLKVYFRVNSHPRLNGKESCWFREQWAPGAVLGPRALQGDGVYERGAVGWMMRIGVRADGSLRQPTLVRGVKFFAENQKRACILQSGYQLGPQPLRIQ